jgi:hypothetical protein
MNALMLPTKPDAFTDFRKKDSQESKGRFYIPLPQQEFCIASVVPER